MLFDVAMKFAAASPVNQAPAHAAVLSRLCGGDASAVASTAAIALAEQARALTASLTSWIAWLTSPAGELPNEALAVHESDHDAVSRLRVALPEAPEVLSQRLSRDAAIVACLHAAGLRTPDQIACALVVARLPIAAAEGLSNKVGDFRHYPANLPPVDYVEDER
jgi:hypothetical protein